ncbi:MAG: sigma-70 family RNA polymerase sigma factor [Actinobacteria bacterium]|nr:sigma-70 family RNA polymerase sigma factor [Actinomycetota bacterium]MBU1942246.1 sigma-70 family RNA polymerase sigma factor [Actinomycetota bacterium]MBU2687405.1 sigma-70 family RNA polymerase sigma factor [Actinomycetota bacterium]
MPKGPEEELLRELVARARDGDRRAYGRIFRACYEDIYDYIARRVGNRSDAEDLAMQVFAQGLKAVESYEERGHSVKAWLYRIAHNAVVDHFRTARQTVDLAEVPEVADARDIEAEVSFTEELHGVYRFIAELPPAQSEVLILRFIEDRSVAETAMILDKKEVTVRALQFKGIRNLREKVEAAGSAPGVE